jgi:hypothetical protein
MLKEIKNSPQLVKKDQPIITSCEYKGEASDHHDCISIIKKTRILLMSSSKSIS